MHLEVQPIRKDSKIGRTIHDQQEDQEPPNSTQPRQTHGPLVRQARQEDDQRRQPGWSQVSVQHGQEGVRTAEGANPGTLGFHCGARRPGRPLG